VSLDSFDFLQEKKNTGKIFVAPHLLFSPGRLFFFCSSTFILFYTHVHPLSSESRVFLHDCGRQKRGNLHSPTELSEQARAFRWYALSLSLLNLVCFVQFQSGIKKIKDKKTARISLPAFYQ
jgi:hypothetical protein